MATVKATIKTTGSFVYAEMWVMFKGKHVKLTSAGVDLAKGDYEMQWEFRADPTASITCSVDMPEVGTSTPCSTGTQYVAHGQTHIGSGDDRPPGYASKIFRVS
jgi:hypothetical protein